MASTGHSYRKLMQDLTRWQEDGIIFVRTGTTRGYASELHSEHQTFFKPLEVGEIGCHLQYLKGRDKVVTRGMQKFIERGMDKKLSVRAIQYWLKRFGLKYAVINEIYPIDSVWYTKRKAQFAWRLNEALCLGADGTHDIVLIDESYCHNNQTGERGWSGFMFFAFFFASLPAVIPRSTSGPLTEVGSMA